MSARKINNNTQGDADWSDEITSKDLLKIGFNNFNLTNYESDYEPKIDAGSAVEVNGYIYVWDYETTITGDLSNYSGIVYIRTELSGDTLSVVYDTTSDLPDWDTAKKGYYDATGNKFLATFILIGNQNKYVNKRYYLTKKDDTKFAKNHILIHDGAFCQIHDVTYGNGYFYLVVSSQKEYNNAYILRTLDGSEMEELYKSPANTGTSYGTCDGRISIANGVVYAYMKVYTQYLHFIAEDGVNFVDTGLSDILMLVGVNQQPNDIFVYNNGVYALAIQSGVRYTTDLSNWTHISVGHQYNAITVASGKFVVWNWLGYQVYYSDDCTSFTQASSPTTGSSCYVLPSGNSTILITGSQTVLTSDFTNFITRPTVPTNVDFTCINTSDRLFAVCQNTSSSEAYEMKAAYNGASPTWDEFYYPDNRPYLCFSNGNDYGFTMKNTINTYYSVFANEPTSTNDNWNLLAQYPIEDTQARTIMGNDLYFIYAQGEKYFIIARS